LGLKDNVLIRTSPLVPPYTHHADGRSAKAYWIYKKVKKAIYGKVTVAYELEPYPSDPSAWRLTDRHVAIKMLLWEQIRRLSGRFEEDPIKEISAMQYLHNVNTTNGLGSTGGTEGGGSRHVCRTVEVLSDARYVYSVMPYLRGGELFDHVSRDGRFTEER
jgi:serine/threonine protein kinase